MPAILSMFLCMLLQGCCLGSNSIIQKKAQQGRINALKDSFVYTTMLAVCQAVIYMVLPPYQAFPPAPGFYAYTVTFSVGFFVQLALFMTAFRLGPATMTSAIRNLNMLVTITLGLLLWGEKLTWFKIIGLAIFITAIFLMNKGSYSVDGKAQKISTRWLVTSIALLLCCGTCGSISKQVMLNYANTEKIYLLTYNLIVIVIGIPLCIMHRKKALELIRDKRFVSLVAVSAALMATADFIYVNFVPKYDSAFFMPLSSTISMISVMVFSRIFLKEKITGRMLLAAGCCIVAVIILSQ